MSKFVVFRLDDEDKDVEEAREFGKSFGLYSSCIVRERERE